jgi:hypothetical protein
MLLSGHGGDRGRRRGSLDAAGDGGHGAQAEHRGGGVHERHRREHGRGDEVAAEHQRQPVVAVGDGAGHRRDRAAEAEHDQQAGRQPAHGAGLGVEAEGHRDR